MSTYHIATAKRGVCRIQSPTGRKPPLRPGLPHFQDIAGRRLGAATVIHLHDYVRSKKPGKRIQWLCLCGCGQFFLAWHHNLLHDKSGQCADCWQRTKAAKAEGRGQKTDDGRQTAAIIPHSELITPHSS